MTSTATTAFSAARINGWDRTVVVALGGAGCALSYDALQQMAVAIHVRGLLTYLFPLVIDGFIAYGVRALLVLKDAPLRARFYVWTLFGTATAASIWANALHAVRLNQQNRSGGLQLGDTVVAILSTIAPLALAGAVHLYILIARDPDKRTPATSRTTLSGHTEHPGRSASVTVTRDTVPGHAIGGQDNSSVAGRPGHLGLSAGQRTPAGGQSLPVNEPPGRQPGQEKEPGCSDNVGPDTLATDAGTTSDRTGSAGRRRAVGQLADQCGHLDKPAAKDTADTATPRRTTADRRGDRDTEELLRIAREAVRAEDKLTRRVVADAIRGQRIPLSNDTLTALMIQLREQHGQHVRTDPS
ncbi:DUF2637 domain-containing protein [Streptomyces sp. PSKA54]|uniref:DUF2637 domain-containing protein n=1 Tax=Streptomyces himalayensis subsp. aureolus TaxID=2758039 RepID=A0A7W2D3G2_9ACTN|nr:DUF2637 domain-containing protein [Streptomyces himalayensis]MBA4864048.1 DUF2637 domain-containing protein [Streptomyces himalayensis subsp. aureolus]